MLLTPENAPRDLLKLTDLIPSDKSRLANAMHIFGPKGEEGTSGFIHKHIAFVSMKPQQQAQVLLQCLTLLDKGEQIPVFTVPVNSPPGETHTPPPPIAEDVRTPDTTTALDGAAVIKSYVDRITTSGRGNIEANSSTGEEGRTPAGTAVKRRRAKSGTGGPDAGNGIPHVDLPNGLKQPADDRPILPESTGLSMVTNILDQNTAAIQEIRERLAKLEKLEDAIRQLNTLAHVAILATYSCAGLTTNNPNMAPMTTSIKQSLDAGTLDRILERLGVFPQGK